MGHFWKEENSLQFQLFTNNNFRVTLEMPKALGVLSSVTYRHPALQQKQSFLCPGGLESFHPFHVVFNGMLAAYPMDIWSLKNQGFSPQLCNINNLVNFSKILKKLVELQ
jgi:hypothetical protein